MTRVVSVGRSHGLVAAGALGIALLTVTLTGCPGSLQNPQDFPPAASGTAGTSGGAGTTAAGGTTGGAGTTGAAGTMASNCDMPTLINTKYMCTLAGACHDATGAAANLSLVQADWPKLVNQVPKGGGAGTASICANDPAFKTIPYIMKGTNPATGLLLTKIKMDACSPGGKQMPNLGVLLSAADAVCFQQWATGLANQ
jgi:hypothetical protein